MINDEMPIDMFRKMMEQLKRIETELFSNRAPSNQYLTISESSKSNIDLKIKIGHSQMSTMKINLNEVGLEEDDENGGKADSDLSGKREKGKLSPVQRNQQKFHPISRVLNKVSIEPNSPIECRESDNKFNSEGKSSKNLHQSLPLASSYFELSQSKLGNEAVFITQKNDEKIAINKNDTTVDSNLGKEGVTFPLCLQTPIKAITEGVKMTSESRRNIEQLQSIANRNRLLFANKNTKPHFKPQQSNSKWAIQSVSKILKQQKIMKPEKGYSDMFIEKNKMKYSPNKGRGNQRYITIACEDESRLNYNSRRSVSRDKLTQYFTKKIDEDSSNLSIPLKTPDGSFEQSRKQVLLKLRKRNNFQNSLRKSSKEALVPYVHIKTTQKKKANMNERQPKRQRSSSIEQISQRLHSGKGKDPCLRFRDRSNSLLKEEFNKLVRKSSLAKRNMGKQDRETLYEQLRKSKDSQSLWPSIITNKALERAKSKRRQNA